MDHNPSGNSAAEDSKTSSSADESDRSDQTNEMGTGRSYECVFCKRGFTTAQALGGHMNIHRKDRVKTKASPTASNPVFSHGSLRSNPATSQSQIMQSQSHHQTAYTGAHHALSMASTEFRVGPTWSLGPTTSHDKGDELYYNSSNNSINNPQLLTALKAENWTTMSLSTRLAGASHSTDHHHQNIQENTSEGNGEEDELDLELRLGHDR